MSELSSPATTTQRSYARFWTSIVLGAIALGAIIAVGIVIDMLIPALIASVFIACMVMDLCYEDSCSRTIISAMSTGGFELSGMLFVVDDLSDLGWLIIFKLLVWLIGGIIGVLGAILSVFVAAVAAPIGLIVSLVKYFRYN